MECACIRPEYDGDDLNFHRSTKIKKSHLAPVLHHCNECRRLILIGEELELVTMKYEDEWEHHVTCTDCLSMRDAFFCGYAYGDIWNDIISYYDNNEDDFSWSSVPKLTPLAQEYLFNKIETYWANTDYGEDDD